MKLATFLKPAGRSSSFSLLVVLPTRLVRADFSGGGAAPRLVQTWEAPCPPNEPLAVLAEAALSLGPSRAGAAYIFATSLWSQFISVPVTKVVGLKDAELANALSFEAEALSGVSPFDSALGLRPADSQVGGERSYWATQVSAAELDQLDSAFTRAGVRLLGVLHPGGLPRTVGASGGADAAWSRVELWADSVFCLDAAAGGVPRVHVLANPPGRGEWMNEAEQWFASHKSTARRELLALDAAQLTAGGLTGSSLQEEQTLRDWLSAWAAELASPAPRVPVVRPAAKPISDQRRYALGAAVGLVAILLCGGHWLWLRSREQSLKAELTKAEEPEKRMAALRAQVTGLEAQLNQVRQQGVDLRVVRADWKESITRERRRHAGLLGIITDHIPGELTLNSIDESAGELHLSGLALQPHFEAFATSLATGTEPLGWRYEPPRRRALNFSPDGGPWLLDWSLKPITNVPPVAVAAAVPPPTTPPGPTPNPTPPGPTPRPAPRPGN